MVFKKDNNKYEDNLLPDLPSPPNFPDQELEPVIEHSINPEFSTNELPKIPGENIKTVEMDEWEPPKSYDKEESSIPNFVPIQQIEKKIQPLPSQNFSLHPGMESSKPGIFVRISKFNLAKKSINEIRNKIGETEELLSKIKIEKNREVQEFQALERDLIMIKSRINSVNEDIFEDVEWAQNL